MVPILFYNASGRVVSDQYTNSSRRREVVCAIQHRREYCKSDLEARSFTELAQGQGWLVSL